MASATAAEPVSEPDAARLAGAGDTSIEITGLDEAATAWRAFEATAVMAPYGRLDWVRAYQRNRPGHAGRTRVALVRDARRQLVALLPCQMDRRLGVAVAAAVGGKHANYWLPLMRPDFAASLGTEQARRLLVDAGRAMGADMIAMPNVPVLWEGWANPFAALGRPSASHAWALRLEPDGEATLARSMSSDARKKLRNKARGLARAGSVEIRRARTRGDVDDILGAFYRQKEQRFGELGISDPFAEAAVRDFLRDAATTGLAEGDPAVELHALLVAGEIVAVVGGASDRRRFSGMIVSFAAGELDRYSPGEMLVTRVVEDLCARGFGTFDLGVGDARYKRSICDTQEALVDVMLPLTWQGRAAALAGQALLEGKRRVKSDARAMALVARMRKLAARLGR